MSLLNPKQIGELQEILIETPGVPNLEQFVHVSLAIKLYDEVPRVSNDRAITYELVRFCERCELTEVLLRALVDAWPRSVALRALFCQLPITQPREVSRPDTSGLAKKIGKVIAQLPATIGPAPSPRLFFVMGQLLDRLKSNNDQLSTLSQYKGLHEALHNLQELLGAIGTAARDYAESHPTSGLPQPAEDDAAECLARYLFDLQSLVVEAQKRIGSAATNGAAAPIASLDDEKKWIAVFADIVSEYGQALASNNPAGITSSIERLRALLRKSYDLNQHLLGVARTLSLPELGNRLQEVLELIPNTAAIEFSVAIDALKQLGPDLLDLVKEHDDWQQLELAFALSESQAPTGAPFEDWPTIKSRLVPLCMINAGDPHATLLLAATNAYGTNAPTGSLAYLRHAFRRMFREVDRRLLDLCEELADQAKRLSTTTQQLAEMFGLT
jgi:hypothetical protein